MRRFDYRSPRFIVDFPVRFTAKDVASTGRCIEISKEGMSLELTQPLPPGIAGIVSMSYQDHAYQIEVRVAHAGLTHGGVEFVYRSESERVAIEQLVESLGSSRGRRTPALLK